MNRNGSGAEIEVPESTARIGFAGANTVSKAPKDPGRFFHEIAPALLYPGRTELIRQGKPVREVYLLSDGLVKAGCADAAGGEIIVGLWYQGAVIGSAPVILQTPSPVTVTTLTNARLHRLLADEFLSLVKNNAEFGWYLQQRQSAEFSDLISFTLQLGCHSARKRLEHLLWRLGSSPIAIESKDGLDLRLPLKQWEIAELISVTPEHLSRILKQLEREGLVLRRRDHFQIPDREKLAHAPDLPSTARSGFRPFSGDSPP